MLGDATGFDWRATSGAGADARLAAPAGERFASMITRLDEPVLKASFGERRFVKLDVATEDLY